MASRIQNYLRTQRRRWGLTQDELAELLGCQSGTQISRIERGKRRPCTEVIVACEVLFGLPSRKLYPGLYAEVEEALLRRAAVLFERLEKEDTLVAKRKQELLTATLRRAIDKSNDENDNDPNL